jgi:hypothetical protein
VNVVVQDGARGAIGAQEVAMEEIEAEEQQQQQNTTNARCGGSPAGTQCAPVVCDPVVYKLNAQYQALNTKPQCSHQLG